MASIQTRMTRAGTKTYVVRWRDAQGNEKSKSFPTLKGARAYRGEVESTLSKGTYIDPGAGKVTLRVHAREWLKTSHAAPGTIAKNKSLLNSHILPTLGDVPVAQMSTVRVKDLLSERSRKGYSPATVRNVKETLAALSHAAVDNGLLTQGWMPRNHHLPRGRSDNRVFLSHQQVHDLANAVDPLYRALILTAAWTGCRWGELAGLRLSRLDLEAKRLDIRQALTYEGGAQFSPLKTGSSRRVIGLTDANVEALTRHLDDYGVGKHQVVFHGPYGAVLQDNNFRRRVWKPAVTKTEGIPDNTRFHDLRHTHAALMILGGVDLKSISTRLGHSTVAITGDRYAHIFAAVEERGLASLDAASRGPEGSDEGSDAQNEALDNL